jgi:CheY-like chemotaxis protein
VEKILFVDDVQAILEGYKRVLHNEFQVDVALGGEEGLRTIAQRGPFARHEWRRVPFGRKIPRTGIRTHDADR